MPTYTNADDAEVELTSPADLSARQAISEQVMRDEYQTAYDDGDDDSSANRLPSHKKKSMTSTGTGSTKAEARHLHPTTPTY